MKYIITKIMTVEIEADNSNDAIFEVKHYSDKDWDTEDYYTDTVENKKLSSSLGEN